MDKNFIYQQRALNPTSIWILFLLLGWSYGSMGKMAKQIFYYLTIGGFFLWAIYRLFTLNKAIKEYNRTIALECGYSFEEIGKLGLL